MSGFNKLTRNFQLTTYSAEEQEKYTHLVKVTDKYGLDGVFVADDSEWESPVSDSRDIAYRRPEDIISHQYVIKYSHYPAMGIVLYRQPGDSYFSFWDLLSVVRYYLACVGYQEGYEDQDYSRLAKQLGVKKQKIKAKLSDSYRIPPIIWTGFFGGVDITAYYDWPKYLDVQKKSKTDPRFIALNRQEFFSGQYSTMIINPRSRRIKYPVTLQFVDTMALGPQGGLAALGDIVGQAKLNTKWWDLQDDLITYRQYLNASYGGYYKQHMRYLLDQRPDDYQRYALGDAEVTLKYLDFFMGNVINVYKEGLIEQVHIPATLASLSDEISAHFSHLPYDDRTVSDIYHDIFDEIDISRFLRPRYYDQTPQVDKCDWDWIFKAIVDGQYNIRLFVDKLSPYLSYGSVVVCLDKDAREYRTLAEPNKVKKCLDFRKLYADNPHFQISRLPSQKIKVSKPRLLIGTLLRNKYADHAHQMRYGRNNNAPTVDDFLLKLYDDSIYSQVVYLKKIVRWTPTLFLEEQLNFDKMRKGYDFVEPGLADRKHKKGSHDQFSVRPDSVYNDGFPMAKRAYVGGMNLCLCPGVIETAYKYKYDIDLRASYQAAGHLIPDFRLDAKPLLDAYDLDSNIIEQYQNHPEIFPNGAFTVGIATVSYHFPDDVKRVPVGYKPLLKGQGPVYVRQGNRIDMTVTDVISMIEHGATVRVHRIIIPQQKKLDGTPEVLAPIGRMQHWSLTKRNKVKKRRDKFDADSNDYLKYDALQLFYKLLGNAGYGKSGQGLGTGATRDFLSDQTMYVPFSRNTNPFSAAQYTSIARYQVNQLMDLAEKVYPDSLIPSVTTDGFIFCTNDHFDEENLQEVCKQTFDDRWVTVNHLNFSDQYFELKSHNHGQKVTTDALINVRTRFNMTIDGHIKALVGLQAGEWTINKLVGLLNNDVVTFKVDDFRMQSLTDMKHSIDNKHYLSMKTWMQPKYLTLSPDDTYEPIDFVRQGEFGYYLTRPFSSIDELLTYRQELKPYRSIFPSFRYQYGELFIQLDKSIHTYKHGSRREKHVAWVHDDVRLEGNGYVALKDNYQTQYMPQALLRYLAYHQEKYDLKKVYTDLYQGNYGRFASFSQALRRNETAFVNPLCVLKENFESKLKKYEIKKG